jgi:hypothetical protein
VRRRRIGSALPSLMRADRERRDDHRGKSGRRDGQPFPLEEPEIR